MTNFYVHTLQTLSKNSRSCKQHFLILNRFKKIKQWVFIRQVKYLQPTCHLEEIYTTRLFVPECLLSNEVTKLFPQCLLIGRVSFLIHISCIYSFIIKDPVQGRKIIFQFYFLAQNLLLAPCGRWFNSLIKVKWLYTDQLLYRNLVYFTLSHILFISSIREL